MHESFNAFEVQPLVLCLIKERSVVREEQQIKCCDLMPIRIPYRLETFSGKHVCLYATYAPSGYITAAVRDCIQTLTDMGYCVFVCVAVENLDHDVDFSNIDGIAGVLIRKNFGMDFSMWARTLNEIPEIWSAESVTCTNDSVFVLPKLMRPMIEQVKSSSADLIFLTESYQIRHHGQSFFFTMQRGALCSDNVREFWARLEPFSDKRKIIDQYETRLMNKALQDWALLVDVIYPFSSLFPEDNYKEHAFNVTHEYWLYLITRGFPLIKAELLRDNPQRVPIFGWKSVLIEHGACVRNILEHLRVNRATVKKDTASKSELMRILSDLNRVRRNSRRRRKLSRISKETL